MRVAVVGGGIFGCTAAIKLHRAGHEVHLFEAKDSLLRCASGINQFRLHAGYHYPRSPETIQECQASLKSFRDEYNEAILYGGLHYYAIARERSVTNPIGYLNALEKSGLSYSVVSSSLVNPDTIDLVISAEEDWIDPVRLRGLVFDHLRGVHVHLNTYVDENLRDEFDHIVVAAYSSTNQVAKALGCEPETFQYEVCEKPVLKMPDEWDSVGLVVMDGPFCSLDPLAGTPYHVMGHVKHAIHWSNVGTSPQIPEYAEDWLNAGIVPAKEVDYPAAGEMLKAGQEFIPALKDAEHVGSMFTVRAVLPNKHDTDERLTIVSQLDDQVIRVFSGKIGTCVQASDEIVSLVGTGNRMAA